MRYSLAEIAAAIGAQAHGDTSLEITALAEPAMARESCLALAMKPEFAAQIGAGRARAAMLWDGADWRGLGLDAAITAPRPRFALSGLSALLDPGQDFAPGRHPTAWVHDTAELAEDVALGPGCVVGPRARIGAGGVIGPQCFIGADVEIGPGALLREQVSIGRGVRIGARFVAQPGARLGGDGFSFVTPEESGVEKARATLGAEGGDAQTSAQSWARIHSLGGVEIGDDVEVGANVCIDRGTVRATRIGDGCKIDNLAQIGHNVEIGRDCLICAQVGIAGSAQIGDHVVLGGQTGISDNVRIGDRVITGGATKVLSSVPAGRVMLGYPATRMDAQMESYRALRRLPRLFRDVAALKNAVFKSGGND
jgi:UDP-3-O-[3-hydroxymyristoyl] glucosamine N-acyltransferase